MCLKYACLAFFILGSIIFAQGLSKSSANISVRLLPATMVGKVYDKNKLEGYPKVIFESIKGQDKNGILLHLVPSKGNNIVSVDLSNSFNYTNEINDAKLFYRSAVREMKDFNNASNFHSVEGSFINMGNGSYNEIYFWIGTNGSNTDEVDPNKPEIVTLSLVYN